MPNSAASNCTWRVVVLKLPSEISGEASHVRLIDLVTVTAFVDYKAFYPYLHAKPLFLNGGFFQ